MALILLNKPFMVLCQFTDEGDRATLADYIQRPGVYPAGRLDFDSEGMVLLTDDGALKNRISHPRYGLVKCYLAQVEGVVGAEAARRLEHGVTLRDGTARAVSVRPVPEPTWIWPRNPPIRIRKNIPTSWIEIRLAEGRNRQVRRMTAAVGFPTLRLIRVGIGALGLQGLAPGQSREIGTEETASLLAGPGKPRPIRRGDAPR
jgi:23S rRNA pseudouridine2457 synthase